MTDGEPDILTVSQGPRNRRIDPLAGARGPAPALLVQSATGFGFALILESRALRGSSIPTEAVTTMLLLGPPLNVLVLLDSGRECSWGARGSPPCWRRRCRDSRSARCAGRCCRSSVLQVRGGRRRGGRRPWQLLRRARGARRRRGDRRCRASRSGALTTSISVSGPPIVLWLEAQGLRPAELRGVAGRVRSWSSTWPASGGGRGRGGRRAVASSTCSPRSSCYAGWATRWAPGCSGGWDLRRFSTIVIALVICTGMWPALLAGLL